MNVTVQPKGIPYSRIPGKHRGAACEVMSRAHPKVPETEFRESGVITRGDIEQTAHALEGTTYNEERHRAFEAFKIKALRDLEASVEVGLSGKLKRSWAWLCWQIS